MKKDVIYIQENPYSCGSVCIQSVISYYGGYIPLETVLEDTNTTSTGTNAYEIVCALRKYGFTSYGRQVPLDDIAKEELPLIAHVVNDGLEHFLVIYEIAEDSVLTMDPAYGKKRYPIDYFRSIYDERAIFLFKEGEIPNYKPTNSLMKIIKSTLNDNKSLLLILLICLASLVLNFLLSFHFKFLENAEKPLTLTLIFILFRALLFGILLIKNRLTEFLIEKMNRSLTGKFTRHIFYLPIRIIARKKTGEIVKKIDDASFIKDLALRITIVNTIDVLLLLCTLIIMFTISRTMTLIYTVLALSISLLTVIARRKLYQKNKENVRAHDEYLGSLVEYTSGLESIKNLSRENLFLKKLENSFETYSNNTQHLVDYTSTTKELKSFILGTGILMIDLIGFLSLSVSFTFYDLLTMQSLFGLCTEAIESILETCYHLSRGRAIYRSLSEFLDIEEEPCETKTVRSPFSHMQIENLSYSHDKIHQNLHNVNLSIAKGDKILLQGPSGVGKSTLAGCLCRRLEGYEGKIFLNDIDIKKLDIAYLRSHIIYIGQEETLFSGTIEENIVGDDYDEDEFQRVLEIASLKEVLAKKPNGQSATILEGASNYSGGERARLILARALYKRPSILIIDETLSSVSEKMEDEILSNIIKDKELTMIYITHRNKDHLFQKKIQL